MHRVFIMHDNYAFHFLLISLVLSIGLKAITADSGDETDVVVPFQLTGDEEVHLLHVLRRSGRRRGQRSLTHPERHHSEKNEDNLVLMLPAFGMELYLQLERDAGFLSPDFIIEEKDDKRTTQQTHIPINKLCFYTGRVFNHSNSFASLSTCGGLTGLVQIGDDSMFIEPVNVAQETFSGVEHKVVRRKRSPKPSSSAAETHPKYCEIIQGKKKEKRPKAAEEGRGRRNAIRLSGEYTVETVVVADSDMVQYHGAEAAQRFILTVMNMVYNMFHHRSLGVRLNIRVTKLVLLHNRPETLKVGHHGERSLESFCHWQHDEYRARYLGNNHVPGGRDDLPPVDVAVFVTRTDFCVHKDEPCDTVGIAYLGGTCSSKRKCVLAEDNGLNLAFTIAHELGHNMGMSHDDDHSTCTGHSHIMSGEWVKGRNPSDLSWSSCSRDDLENFLRSKSSACLLHTDPRSYYTVRLPSKLPGMHYSADEQCQILFGTNATFCSNMEHLMCAGLWCLVGGDTSCKTKLDPPLDGTECGADKWCRAGDCVSKTPIPQHVDGDWSTWGQWSVCSRTCGTGAKFRQRKCDNPPPGPGGRHCQKASVEHRACEGPPCAKGSPTFRDQQCQSHDRQASKKKTNLWTAVISDEKPCALFCAPMGRDVPIFVSERVLDGTPCGPYDADLCVNGKCQKIGCDGVIGSSAKEDRCGVCNGDGKSCKIVKGDFNHTKGMVTSSHCKKVSTCVMSKPRAVPKCFSCYIEAAIIPAGARRIKVVEDKPSHSFLALKDSSKRSINSDWKIELPGEFQLAGTTVRYVRRGLWEKISAKGPTKTPLHLLVLLFHDQTYGIHYEYTISLNRSQENNSQPQNELPHLYIWTHSSWGECSVQCGGGERSTIVSCMKIVNRTMTLVNDSHCRLENRPLPQVRRCNTHPCQSRWVTAEWGPCSVTCGKGLQLREVLCVYQLQNGSYINTRDLYCQGPKPAPMQGCEGRHCLTVWEASEWSQCSSECGRGVRRRTITCTNPQGQCDPTSQPTEEEACEDHSKCYEWKTGDWSKCSSSCGKGLQSRVVQCMHRVTGRHGSDCPAASKPPAYRQCHQGACNEKVNVNTITSPRLAALTYKCMGDQWDVYCQIIRAENLCQDMRWYQRCCQTCRDFYANKMLRNS
ncbi:A disintegrin and metalloproteinase with thrombospondin motifs 17 isoform X1 [Conger conger]|uniref:A disintegrin and metalloproteinase with thrombospondin motifs 17 isoform X1 n=1 Tax=Conger conger TaxID=82655 RepID=UPI002A59FB86|nr:A disintegrin and metalloproteinase with thrombospondin motifs 17 isoform X1 [Conger conger]